MDLAFAAACVTPEHHGTKRRGQGDRSAAAAVERAVEADKAEIARSRAYEKAGADKKDALDDQLDVAKAKQELDQDEADDAKQDLIRAAAIRRGESSRWSKSTKPPRMWRTPCTCRSTIPSKHRIDSPVQRWSALHQKQLLLGARSKMRNL